MLMRESDRALGVRLPTKLVQHGPIVYYAIDAYAPWAYNFPMIIIETSVFTKLISQLMDDDQYRELQELLIENRRSGISFRVRVDSAISVGNLPDEVSGVV